MRGSGSQARLIEDFLRREFGVKRVEVEHRTKHAKLHWTHQGSAYSYLCSRNTTGDGHAAIQNARSNIRRMMRGAAFNPVVEEEGGMEDVMEAIREKAILQVQVAAPQPASEPALSKATMAPEAGQPEPAKIWPGMVSGYKPGKGNATAHFFFPAGIAKVLPAFTVEQLDEEHWKFRKGGRHWRPVPWARETVRTSISTEPLAPFRAMPVDAIEADGEVLVYVPMAGRVSPMTKRFPPRRHAVKPPLKEEPMPAPEKIAMHERPVPHPMPPMEFRMRVILEQARELEKQTPYRLIRQDDRLVWQAPVIA